MSYYDKLEKGEILNNIIEISEEIEIEQEQENINQNKVTKLMFEQMLRGLYLQI
ncbi:MAG: hypothetical protein IKT40_09035 [Bacilli bacterium]|nr:hypothetical protein [Bacilli bacterium]